MIRLARDFLTGSCFLFLAGWLFFICLQEKNVNPAYLPDYDYFPEIEKLTAEKRFQEAETLCCDVIGMGLPNAHLTGQKFYECRAARRSWGRNALDAAKGFLTGNGENSAAVTGAIISDLCLYGDLRDLGLQGCNKIKGRPVDMVLVTLSGIGALSEIAGLAGSVPAVAKQLYKTGALTSQMFDQLRGIVFRFKVKGSLAAADKQMLKNLERVTSVHGFQCARRILKGINTQEELAALVNVAKKAPEVPRLLSYTAPADSGKILLTHSEKGFFLLKNAVRKGRPGIDLLRKIRIVKWSAKNILQGRFHDLMLFSAVENPAFRRVLPYIGGSLLLAALVFYGKVCFSGGKVLRALRKKHSTAEDGL